MKFIDLPAQYKTIKKSVNKAVLNTIENGNFILGENVLNLEEKIAEFTGAGYAVGLNSGTDALYLSLKALGIGKGDEVITTPFSFVATAETIAATGAKPVFADINSRTYNIDPDKIEKAITEKTKATIPVHLYGQMADMKKIMQIAKRKNLFVIEDTAQALGAKQQGAKGKAQSAGSIGDAGCFSFFPTKNLGAYGDGGMVTSNNAETAEKIKMMRNHGSRKKYHHEFLAVSSRLDELQAAVLLAKLPHLEKWNNSRRKIAAIYTKELSGIDELTTPFVEDGNFHIYHQFTIRTAKREELRQYLKERGIPTAIHYPLPIHLQPAFADLKLKPGAYPESEKAAKEVLSLPVYPELPADDQKKVIRAIHSFFGR